MPKACSHTTFAPAILKMRDLGAYDGAELVRKKIETCFVAFVMDGDDGDTLGAATTDGEGQTFDPGACPPAGKNVRFG